MLQNGVLPRFMANEKLEKLFTSVNPNSPCVLSLRQGLNELEIYQIAQEIPLFVHLFRQNEATTLPIRRIQEILKPDFSEQGSNTRVFEGKVYTAFVKYLREVASGRRGNIALGDILRFCTGADQGPVLGYALHPSIIFVEANEGHFIPTANTCINCLKLPRPSLIEPLPSMKTLHDLYDYAFANAHFGLV
ncbi:uncharacterized protein [Montipora capricornis]|uniref:uncharacterized protein n=1 Tax=Montipora capricornis TaxID=246305 RepID=UPI0035F15C49